MALTKNQFAVLAHLVRFGNDVQREIAEATGLSLGSVNASLRELKAQDLVDVAGRPTELAFEALAPYKVDNAIIMAAGMSSRFAPLSYERPKGTLQVKGEVLIERQIRQLQEAGIHDITVVVGYMKEQFFYLEDKFGCKIRVNEVYEQRNNNSTLMLMRESLGNTYICSSDNYFTENVFEPYVYEPYYAAAFFEGPTSEYLLTCGTGKRITSVQIGGSDAYGMLGHAYFDRAFSKRFREILEAEYDLPETAPKLWEDIYIEHIAELPMVMRPYDDGVIWEFDSLGELKEFDKDFVENVDSSILDNICATLSCVRNDIQSVSPLNSGQTNLSFKFEVAGAPYVYRHPGVGTDSAFIDRKAEVFAQGVAHKLGFDDTYIHEDADEGWKIAHFLPESTELDYHDDAQVEEALRMIRTLHDSGEESWFNADLHTQTLQLVNALGKTNRSSFTDFQELFDQMNELADYVAAENIPPCLCHNGFWNANLLVSKEGKVHLIDWEYAAMSDYASDLGTFICCSDYSVSEAKEIIQAYFQREPTKAELIHCLIYIALASYHWFIWELYRDMRGNPAREWLYIWYRSAKTYAREARMLIDQD